MPEPYAIGQTTPPPLAPTGSERAAPLPAYPRFEQFCAVPNPATHKPKHRRSNMNPVINPAEPEHREIPTGDREIPTRQDPELTQPSGVNAPGLSRVLEPGTSDYHPATPPLVVQKRVTGNLLTPRVTGNIDPSHPDRGKSVVTPPSVSQFDPLVAEWFTNRFGHPTEPQIEGWREIAHRPQCSHLGSHGFRQNARRFSDLPRSSGARRPH